MLVVASLIVAVAVALTSALLQGLKPFYYDSGQYWELGQTFTLNGHFSLLNFDSQFRGYALPLIFHWLQEISEALSWNPSSLVKLFNVLAVALVGAVLAPRLAETAWPSRPWGPLRRLLLVALLIVYWRGFLSYPLSDFPALAMALLALIAIAKPDAPGWMLAAGAAAGLALDIRATYLLLEPMLVLLVAWAWFSQRGTQHASRARRALCASMLVVGFAVVSLPQSLASHRHGFTWSFVPGATLPLASEYLTPGMSTQFYATYVGPGEPAAQMEYRDPTGERLLATLKGDQVAGLGQYLGLIASHPVAMGALLARRVINGLDSRFSTPYVEHLESGSRRWLRAASFLLVFLALVRALWPAARRRLAPARWRYQVVLVLCSLTSVPTPVEARYMLPVYMFAYITVLTPGWPSPVGPAGEGLRRLRTLAIMAGALLVFAAIVWHVTSATSSQLHFG